MLLKRNRTHSSILSMITIFINIIYVVHCIRPDLILRYESFYQMVGDMILPRRFISILYIFAIAYLLGKRYEENVLHVLLMQNRTAVWKSRLRTSAVTAFADTWILLMIFLSVNAIYFKDWNEWQYIFLTGIFIALQLCASFVFIELIKWIFNSSILGFIIIVAMGISDAYTPLPPLFYRQFSILNDLVNHNMHMMVLKILCCFIINCVLILAGYAYSGKKEFYDQGNVNA